MSTLQELITQLATVIPDELLEDAPVTDANFNKVVKSIKMLSSALVELRDRWGCPSIGDKYWRFPGVTIGTEVLPEDPHPQDKWPGTAWDEITVFYANKYFRVEGSKTVAFGSGAQGWALVDHGHEATTNGKTGETNFTYAGGRYDTRKAPRDPATVSVGAPTNRSVALTVADELRVENYAIKGYRRRA